jgi:hypothetical protein
MPPVGAGRRNAPCARGANTRIVVTVATDGRLPTKQEKADPFIGSSTART